MISAIAAVHAKRLIHRDIKPQNILVEGEILKLADFGLARSLTEPSRPYTEDVCTVWYKPPEVMLRSGNYSTEVDIWSIGCVFFEMVASKVLFAGDSDIDMLYRIFSHLGTPSIEEWAELYDQNRSPQLARVPIFQKQTLVQHYPDLRLSNSGFDLLSVACN